MTITCADPLAGLLFGREAKLVNLKMCRGDSPQVSGTELRNETHFALTQVALGMCETHVDFPEDRTAKRVDLNQLRNI
jgi:hypothetical protein